MDDPVETAGSPPADTPPTRFETVVSLVMGGLLLAVATSLCFWGVRLALAGLKATNWPPGLAALLLPILLAALAVGFGSWRLLLVGLPRGIAGMSVERIVLALFVLAIIGGVVA